MHSKEYFYRQKSLRVLLFFTNPLFLFLSTNILALLFFLLIPEDTMLSFAGESKYISIHSLSLYIIFLLAFCVGYLMAPNEKIFTINSSVFHRKVYISMSLFKFFGFISFILYVIGYILWFKALLIEPFKILFLFFNFGTYGTRSFFEQKMISGITTLTQVGIFSAIIYYILYLVSNKKKYLIPIFVIICLSIIRVLFFGERLATLEVLIPLVFIYLRFYPEKIWRILKLGSIIFIILWSSELWRSYISPMYSSYNPIQFLCYRLFMYFSTTINNAFLIFDKYTPFQDFLPYTLKFFYKLFSVNILDSYRQYKSILETLANPEYNNKSFFGDLYFDWGYFGLIISFLYGVISKIAYNQYKKFTIFGMLFYSIILVFLLQSYRINYLMDSRSFYPLFFSIIFYIYLLYLLKYKSNKLEVPNDYN